MTTENELLTKLKSGQSTAFTELVALYQKKVLNICYRFLLDRQDAEDVSQDVFLEIYNSIRNFREKSKLSTWIYRIAVSKSLDEIKKKSRKKRITSVGKTLGLEKVAIWITGQDRPDKTLEENEDLQLILTAMNKLPENQRIALNLSKIEGNTNQEVAEIMQISITAVDSLIYRAKQNLKVYLKL